MLIKKPEEKNKNQKLQKRKEKLVMENPGKVSNSEKMVRGDRVNSGK